MAGEIETSNVKMLNNNIKNKSNICEATQLETILQTLLLKIKTMMIAERCTK